MGGRYTATTLPAVLGVVIWEILALIFDDEKTYSASPSIFAAGLAAALQFCLSTASWFTRLREAMRELWSSAALSALSMALSSYVAYTILFGSSLPSEVMVAEARWNLSHDWLASTQYFMAGCFTSLRSAKNHLLVMLLVLRGAQICAVDAQPLEMVRLYAMVVLLPFSVGCLFMYQQEQLVRKMRHEISFAKRETRSTIAHAVAERNRADALETARLEMLVARKMAQKRRTGDAPTSSTPKRARPSNPDMQTVDTLVLQEDGYLSPALVD